MISGENVMPWPVLSGRTCLIATHWPPDVDGLACAAAWYDLAKTGQPAARLALYVPDDCPRRFEWLLDGMEQERGPELQGFDRCLVLDCRPEPNRTRLPEGWLASRAALGRVWHVDHHDEGPNSGVTPALACAFIDQGLYHPLFFSSIWSDTHRLSFHQSEAVGYLVQLFSAGLDDSEVARQQRLLEPRRPEILFRDVVERTEILRSTEISGVGSVLVVASAEPWRHEDTMHEVREWLLHYADLVVVIDTSRGRVSLWSSSGRDLGLGLIATRVLGGGGHAHMAGGPLGDALPSTVADQVISAVGRYVVGQNP